MNFVVDAKSSLIISIRDEKGAFRGTTLIHTEICMHFIDTLYCPEDSLLYKKTPVSNETDEKSAIPLFFIRVFNTGFIKPISIPYNGGLPS